MFLISDLIDELDHDEHPLLNKPFEVLKKLQIMIEQV